MRDLRDPQKLGEALLIIRKKQRDQDGIMPTLHHTVDNLPILLKNIPEVSKDESMGKECVRAYRAELEERAAGGDKYAQSALTAIEKGEKVEYDEG